MEVIAFISSSPGKDNYHLTALYGSVQLAVVDKASMVAAVDKIDLADMVANMVEPVDMIEPEASGASEELVEQD
jgi:hypothetical protein